MGLGFRANFRFNRSSYPGLLVTAKEGKCLYVS